MVSNESIVMAVVYAAMCALLMLYEHFNSNNR